MFYAVFVSLLSLYHSDGHILLVLLRQRLILPAVPIFSSTSVAPTFFCCFALGRFDRFPVRPESFRITVATFLHAVSPNNNFYQMFLSAIIFVTDVVISLIQVSIP